jgi:cobyrinic acid a,c-diamide synthase
LTARGLIVAAPRSGSGKTIITLALLAALSRRGLAVRAAKAGPDYIDAAFHAAAVRGVKSINLDSWAMPPPLLDALFAQAGTGADILVVEGVMGLFDGIGGSPEHDPEKWEPVFGKDHAQTKEHDPEKWEPVFGKRSCSNKELRCGSTADLAARFRLPVLLVVDISGQSQSAAALVRGFAGHDAAVRVAGVLLNRVASDRHRQLAADAIAALNIPVLGAMPRDERLRLPERHLGLVQAGEHGDIATRIDHMADLAERHCDLDAVMAMATETVVPAPANILPLRPPGQRIALACDAAFTFIYPHIVEGWRRAGADIAPFSPLADEAPPQGCDCCWLSGGYPELHAAALSAAHRFRAGLAQFAKSRPVHGECGGYMVLGEGLEDGNGVRHAMAGLLGHCTSFAKRKLQLGYREARLLCDGPLGSAGATLRGHEFHYAILTASGNDQPFCDLCDGYRRPLGPSGGRRGNVTGSFFHAIAAA